MNKIIAFVLGCLVALPAFAQQHIRQEVLPGITLVYESLDDQEESVELRGMEWAQEADVVISIPEFVTANGKQFKVVQIGENAFRNRDITQVVLPPSIRVIGRNAFTDCRYLRSISLNNNLEAILFEAFRGCMNLQAISFPASLKRIERGALQDCFALKQLELPAISYIPADLCRYCIGLKSVSFPSAVKKIGSEAFKECRSLKIVVNNDILVGHKAFFNCASVKNADGVDLTAK